MLVSGQSPDGRLVEIVELRDHPWFVASQFHPEFRSRPDRPHPLFLGFVARCWLHRRAAERAHGGRIDADGVVPATVDEPYVAGRAEPEQVALGVLPPRERPALTGRTTTGPGRGGGRLGSPASRVDRGAPDP